MLTPYAEEREERIAEEFPPTGRFVTIDGIRLHAHVEGRGPDLVLLHGANGSLRDFTFDLVGRLARDFRVIAIDRPGLGWSDPVPDAPVALLPRQADLMRAVAAELGARRPLVLGHSYGGAVALNWALNAPGSVAGLVLVSPASHPWDQWGRGVGPWYNLMASDYGGERLAPVVTALTPDGIADPVVNLVFRPNDVPEGYVAHLGAALSVRRLTLQENARQMQILRPQLVNMARYYDRIAIPVEIVQGDADPIVLPEVHAERLAAEIPGANLLLLEGVGHMPHHADPEAVVAAVHRAARRAGLR